MQNIIAISIASFVVGLGLLCVLDSFVRDWLDTILDDNNKGVNVNP